MHETCAAAYVCAYVQSHVVVRAVCTCLYPRMHSFFPRLQPCASLSCCLHGRYHACQSCVNAKYVAFSHLWLQQSCAHARSISIGADTLLGFDKLYIANLEHIRRLEVCSSKRLRSGAELSMCVCDSIYRHCAFLGKGVFISHQKTQSKEMHSSNKACTQV